MSGVAMRPWRAQDADDTREGCLIQSAKLPGPDDTRIDNVAFAKLRPAAT